ncbi:hypothetical protein M3Y99_01324200 [Aphelenchoides fujianensis]|nr:hypothetical protein M3Y99_01324200 [Aphelenchoides fujianensis]
MHNYRYFLNLIVFFDVLFAFFLGVCLQPDEMEPLIGASMRGLVRTHEQASLVATLTVYVGTHVVCTQFYALVYRFTAILIDKRYQKALLSTPGKLVVYVYNQFWSLLVSGGFYWTIVPKSGVKDVLLKAEYDRPAIRAGDPVLLIFWHRQYDHVFYLSLVGLFMFVHLMSILLVVAILESLKRNSSVFSATTKKLHVQFVTLLCVQIATPLVLLSGPIFLWVALFVHGTATTTAICRVCFVLFTATAPLSGLSTIALISPYRQHCSAHVIRPFVWSLRFLMSGCKRPEETVEQQTAAVEPRTMSGAFALSFREDAEE